jgi:hypothetical protein
MTQRVLPVAVAGSPSASALQIRPGHGILKQPEYLSGLSRGSYIVGALALVAISHINPVADRKPQFTGPTAKMPVFSQNSPDCERGCGAG